MSKNIDQIFIANPITSNAATDLMYFGQSPYGAGNDAAMLYSNFAAQFGAPYTASALTAANDTNVTLTLGGTPATALLHAASITAGWTGQLAVGRGGTGSASFNINGVVISGATTTTALTSLTLSDGQVVIGSSIGAPLAATLTAGSGISVANGHNTITISGTTNALTYNDVSGTTQAAAVNNGYIISNSAQTTVTLPATAPEGSVVAVQGKGAAGWILAANTGQVIHFGSVASSSGGSLTSINQWDAVEVVCVTANTTWAVKSVIGNLTVA